jgi:hypothetical protein
MSVTLAKALEGLGLQPGQTYRTVVEGHEVEVRVLDDAPTPELAGQVMLLPWAEFPHPRQGQKVVATPGSLQLSPPPEIPADEGEV